VPAHRAQIRSIQAETQSPVPFEVTVPCTNAEVSTIRVVALTGSFVLSLLQLTSPVATAAVGTANSSADSEDQSPGAAPSLQQLQEGNADQMASEHAGHKRLRLEYAPATGAKIARVSSVKDAARWQLAFMMRADAPTELTLGEVCDAAAACRFYQADAIAQALPAYLEGLLTEAPAEQARAWHGASVIVSMACKCSKHQLEGMSLYVAHPRLPTSSPHHVS
jgi:hypothetical protein